MIKYITNPIHSLTQSYTAAQITSLLTQQLQTGTLQLVPPGLSSIENDANGIKKLLLKTQVSLTCFLHSEVNQIIHIIFVLEAKKLLVLLENRAWRILSRPPGILF